MNAPSKNVSLHCVYATFVRESCKKEVHESQQRPNGSFDGVSVFKWRLDHRSVETDESWDILNFIV